MPVQDEQEIREADRTTLHDPGEHRADDLPDLREGLARGQPQGGGVLGRTEYRDVAVVVDLDEVGPPHDVHGEVRLEEDADGGAKALGPSLDPADAGPRPVERADPIAHRATTDEEVFARSHG